MNKDTIYNQMATRLKKDVTELNDELRFKEDLNLDSIDMVEIVMDMEEEYGISIADEDAVNIKTIGDLIKVLES